MRIRFAASAFLCALVTKDTKWLGRADAMGCCTESWLWIWNVLDPAMLALPGRTHDSLGPGGQQKHWRLGPGAQGIGARRAWLPWISVNHLHGSTGLADFDRTLYLQLAMGN